MALQIIHNALRLASTEIPKLLPEKAHIKQLDLQLLRTGGKAIVTMIRGEGCGPELTSYVEEVFDTAEVPVMFDVQQLRAGTPNQREDSLQSVIHSINSSGIALAGYLDKDVRRTIGDSLRLSITVSRNQSYHSELSKKPSIDNVVIRSHRHYSNRDAARSIDFGTAASVETVNRFTKNTETLTRFAFEIAGREGRNKVTTVHETIGEKASDVISLEVAERIAEEYYPSVRYSNVGLNSWLRQLAQDPSQFDVLLLHNFHPGLRYDLTKWIEDTTVQTDLQSVGSQVVFEAMEKKYSRNPIPMLSAGVHLLEHLGLHSHAKLIKLAIHATVCRDGIRTRDLGGKSTSRSVVDYINHFITLAKLDQSFTINSSSNN